MTRTVPSRPRIWFRLEDFAGLADGDSVLLPVRPTGRDSDYPEPFDIEVPVKWWNAQSYIHSRSWTDEGTYHFPKPTAELREFIRPGAASLPPLLVEDGLVSPTASIAYRLGRWIAELKGQHSVQLAGDVDFEELAADGFCSIEPATDLFTEVATKWERRGQIGTDLGMGCLSVRWNGKSFKAIRVRWIEMFDRRNAIWVLGDSAQDTKAFAAALLEAHNVPNRSVLVFAQSCFQNDRELFRAVQSASWEELVLAGDLASRIRGEVVSFLESRPLYERYGVPYKRGVLLSGPPGNGKTHCVRLLIKQASLPTIYVKNFTARYGEDEGNIGNVFRRARQLAPCMLVLEDLDSLVKPQHLSVFLNEMDGIRSDTGILTIATTNHPERLDPALLERPSRFDRKYHFGLPGVQERRRYIDHWNSKLEAPLRIDEPSSGDVAIRTDGLSFAFLKELMLSSMMRWMSESGTRPMGAVALAELETLRATWRPQDEGDLAASTKPSKDDDDA